MAHENSTINPDSPITPGSVVGRERIYLSPPHMSGLEQKYVNEAFQSNWLSSIGPNIDHFEREFVEETGCGHALAVASGTSALHLSLILAGVGQGDEVFVSTYTFCASVNPIIYQGARPVFIDSDAFSWNMDPGLLASAIEERLRSGRPLPKALVLVHLYGQSADIDPILHLCEKHDITLIEDAAEALGASYKGRAPGTFGRFGIYSFNGNKIITTTGGGMLVSNDEQAIAHARKLATQARDPAPHYQHSEIGYNYRMSNVLAGIGRGQLRVLKDRVEARRRIFDYYREALGDLPGLTFMPEAAYGRHTRWLSCLLVDPRQFGVDREALRLALEAENIESRPTWKPMHLQPVYQHYESIGGDISRKLFEQGLCLPSGSNLSEHDLDRVIEVIRRR